MDMEMMLVESNMKAMASRVGNPERERFEGVKAWWMPNQADMDGLVGLKRTMQIVFTVYASKSGVALLCQVAGMKQSHEGSVSAWCN